MKRVLAALAFFGFFSAAQAQQGTVIQPPSCATVGCTMTGSLLFSTDNTVDIGANGATRPRHVYVGTDVTIGAGAAITSSGAGGALGTAAFVSTGTSGATVPLLNGANTFSGNTTISSASLITSGAISAAAWTTGGIRLKHAAASYTDTSSSGTVADGYSDLFGATTILASSATTFTNYYGTAFFAPVASTNVTMTNKAAVYADSLVIGADYGGTAALRVNAVSALAGNVFIGGASAGANGAMLLQSGGGIITVAGTIYGWPSSTTNANNAPDTGLSRDGAGQVDVGNGTAADFSGTIKAAHATLTALANTATTSAVCYNTGTGVLTYDGTVGTCTVSDERLKNMGERIPGALAKLLQINGVYGTWKDQTMGAGRQIFIGAQTVERVFPELVQTDTNGRKSLDYQRLTAPIIEALRELKADNDNLRADVIALKRAQR